MWLMPVNGDAWRIDEQRFRSLVENASDVITVVGPDLTILFQTHSGAQMLGYRAAELEGTKFATLVDPSGLAQLRATCAEAADGIGHRPVQLSLQHRDGTWLDGETVVRYEADGGLFVLTTRDVRERKRAERQLRRQAAQQAVVARLGAHALAGEELCELMLQASCEVSKTLDADYAGVLQYFSDRDVFTLFAGVGLDACRRLRTTFPGRGSQPGLTLSANSPVIVRDWESEDRFDEAKFMSAHEVASGISALIPGVDGPFGVISVQATERNRFNYDDGLFLQAIANILAAAIARSDGEEKIRHQALHDAVTNLPNRTLFEDRLQLALATARRHERRLAVLFLDLDSFKRVNDSLGHAAGDVVLKSVATRLSGCLRDEDTLARFGGDEFAVLLPEIDDDQALLAVVDRIQEALRLPLSIEGRQIVTTASVGIAIGGAGRSDESAEALVRDADLAMYAAKQRGPGRWEFFAEHMYDTAVQRLTLTGDLYDALERDELEVRYQPIVALDDEAIVGMEALVRWNHPRHGLLSPAVFLPLAEETGLIIPLGRMVLRAACRNLRRWQLAQPRHRNLYVSVNLATQEIHAPDLVSDLRTILDETGVAPASLILEITEGVLLATDESVTTRLQELKDLGVRLAVDDFGTGYSALSYLQRFPMDILKIDKTFVDGLGGSSEQDRLVKGIIELAHDLNLETVAEGIERADQAAALRTMRSELGQGFHFAKALTCSDMDAVLSPVPAADTAAQPRAGAVAG
jgi:diguanylate cyclase (GGDEF)-like protein/PAS domain S-box-containing protein